MQLRKLLMLGQFLSRLELPGAYRAYKHQGYFNQLTLLFAFDHFLVVDFVYLAGVIHRYVLQFEITVALPHCRHFNLGFLLALLRLLPMEIQDIPLAAWMDHSPFLLSVADDL